MFEESLSGSKPKRARNQLMSTEQIGSLKVNLQSHNKNMEIKVYNECESAGYYMCYSGHPTLSDIFAVSDCKKWEYKFRFRNK